MKLKNFFALSSHTAIGVLAFSLIGTLVSCTSEDAPVAPVESLEAITFTTNINGGVLTRASDDKWVAGDEVGIYMLDVDGELSEDYHAANFRYKIESYNTTLWKLVPYNTANNLYYPEDDSDVRFTAYYPYKDLTDSNNGTETNLAEDAPGTYLVELGEQDKPETFDLLYHKGVTDYKKSTAATTITPMEFKHQLSKVVIHIKLSGDMVYDDIEDMEMEITIKDIPTSAIFDLSTGDLSAWGALGVENDKDDVITNPLATPAAGYVCTHEAIIVPHTVANESVYFDRTIDFAFKDPEGNSKTHTYNIPNTDEDVDPVIPYKAFVPEKKTIYVFTISRGKIIVENVTVKDWVLDGSNIEEEISL